MVIFPFTRPNNVVRLFQILDQFYMKSLLGSTHGKDPSFKVRLQQQCPLQAPVPCTAYMHLEHVLIPAQPLPSRLGGTCGHTGWHLVRVGQPRPCNGLLLVITQLMHSEFYDKVMYNPWGQKTTQIQAYMSYSK